MDSTLLIDVLNGLQVAKDEIQQHTDRAISIVTWIEVMAGIREGEAERVKSFLQTFRLLDLAPSIATEAAHLRRTTRLKMPDAVILATAHIEGRILLTRNTRDFHPGRFVRIPYSL